MEYLLFRPDVLALCNFILYIGLKALPDRENVDCFLPVIIASIPGRSISQIVDWGGTLGIE